MTTELLTRVPNINHHRGLDRKGFLHWAAINNWDEVIQIAIDKAGAKLNQIDSSGKTPLHYAAELGNHAATKRLVRCGASVQISDNIGMTAVQVAAMAGFADVLNLLLQESDYDINASDTNGFSLLHWAASWDWVSIIRIVVEHADVDLSRRNGYGQTALHIAARCGCPSVLQVLLELGYYDINQVDGCGNSLLHLGAKSGSLKVCKDILELPLVDLKRQNNFGQTALNCAEVYDKTGEIPALLTAAGVRFGYASREPPHFIQSQTSHLEWTMLDQKIKQEQQKNPFWGAIQVLAICAFRGCNIMCERSRCKGCLLYYCPQHTSKDSHKCNLRHND
jgi:ankyrin repeat protein